MKEPYDFDQPLSEFFSFPKDRKLTISEKLILLSAVFGVFLIRDVIRYKKTGKKGIFLKVIDLILIGMFLLLLWALLQTHQAHAGSTLR